MSTTIKNLIILSFGLILFSCGKKPQQMQLPPVNVSTLKVSEGSAAFYDEYPATITALNQVELRPQVNGYINEINFKEGDRVKKGDLLYTIDQQQYQAIYQQAQANVAVQEANLERAQKDVNRYRELDKHDAVAKQQLDNAEATYESAKKQVDAAKANVRSVQTAVRYTNIYAPFDGTIGISQVKLGAAVSQGQTVLNTISSDNPVVADFVIDQKEIFHFNQLLHQARAKNDSTFSFVFSGQEYKEYGSLYVMDRAVNAQTGTLTVRVMFPNPLGLLRVGMAGTVRVLNYSAKSSVLIPFKAVTEQLGEFFVYKVNLDSSKVSQQRITLGKQVGRDVIIHTGLQEGETIVVEGVQALREGAKVNLNAGKPEAKKEEVKK